jgi:ATP-binding cassette subfamily C protein CydC
MKAICGLYHPQSGYAAVNGVISAEMDVDDRRENFTYLPSTTYLYSIDSSQNILLNACGDEEYKLDTAIELAQIDNNGENSFLHSQKDQISGGQAQRVNIARAVIRKTPLLLADEPTAGLPKMQGEKILSDLLDEYETAVVVTHHRDQLKYFDRVIYMENGKIVSMNK